MDRNSYLRPIALPRARLRALLDRVSFGRIGHRILLVLFIEPTTRLRRRLSICRAHCAVRFSVYPIAVLPERRCVGARLARRNCGVLLQQLYRTLAGQLVRERCAQSGACLERK